MKKIIMIFLLLLPFITNAEKKALLIGNKNYQSSPLTNPENDVNGLAQKLTDLKFTTVIPKYNLNRKQMRLEIRNFSANLKSGDIAVVFYSGHGMQVEGTNYLIPVNNDIRREFDVSDGGVSLDFILNNLEKSASKANIVILDACRDNPFKRRFKSSLKGLARIDQSLGTIVAFSAGQGQVSDDGRGKYSVYTKHLLKHIASSGISINDVFMRVRKSVTEETQSRQVPKEENGLTEPIFLAGRSGRENPPPPHVVKRKKNNCHAHPKAVSVTKNSNHCHPNPTGVHSYLKKPQQPKPKPKYRTFKPKCREYKFWATIDGRKQEIIGKECSNNR